MKEICVYVSPEHLSVPVCSACFPLRLSQAILSSLVNILRCCVPPRRRPLSSSFSLWRDLLDRWHFHPPFLLALYHSPLSLCRTLLRFHFSVIVAPPHLIPCSFSFFFCQEQQWPEISHRSCLFSPSCTAKCPWTCIDPAWGIISFTSVHSRSQHTRHGDR